MLHISDSVQRKDRVITSVREQNLSLWVEANEHSEHYEDSASALLNLLKFPFQHISKYSALINNLCNMVFLHKKQNQTSQRGRGTITH